MKIYILDRNVIAEIKVALAGKQSRDQCWREKLKSLDVAGNVITPITSVIEGQLGRMERENEKREAIAKEVSVIGKYFTKAKVDNYLQSHIAEAALVLSGRIEDAWNEYLCIIKEAQPKFYQNMSDKETEEQRQKLLALLRDKNIAICHPVAVCCLSALYGSSDGRKVLKSKKKIAINEIPKLAHNALSDIMIVSRLNFFRAMFDQYGGAGVEIEFVTFDSALENFLSWYPYESVELTTDGVDANFRPKIHYFPKMSEQTFESMYGCASSTSQSRHASYPMSL
jgi:hypothetical protein